MAIRDQLAILLRADNASFPSGFRAALPVMTSLDILATSAWPLSLESTMNVSLEPTVNECGIQLDDEYFNVWRDVKFWCLAFIIPVGLVFNFISLGVFITSWMRHVVSGRYFMALALADNLVLIGELLLWMNTTDRRGSKLGMDFHHSVDFFCKFTNFLRYGARMWSSWLTVAITIERFLSVHFPFKIMRLSNPTKAVVVVTTIGVICFSLACFTFFTLEAKPYNGKPLCQYIDRKVFSVWVLVVIAGIGEMVLPSIIVTIFTLLIIWKLAIARQERLRMRHGDGQTQSRGRRHKTSEIQPTIALIAIDIVFISIRMPYVIMFFVNTYKKNLWQCLDKWLAYKIYVIYTVSMVMAVLNYAVNFCLYCISGTAFRTEVRRCMVHRVSNHLLPRPRSNIGNSRGRDSYLSRGGSSPAASCPAAPVTTHTWGRKDMSDGCESGADCVHDPSSGPLEGAETYLDYRSAAPDSPPLWSEPSRQPAKTLKVVRNGNHPQWTCKNKLRVSLSEEYISTKQTNVNSGGTASETEVVTYGTIDAEGHHKRGRVELKPISRKELAANRKCLDYRPLSGIYDPKTETVFFVTDTSLPKWRRNKSQQLNCFSSRNPAGPDFC